MIDGAELEMAASVAHRIRSRSAALRVVAPGSEEVGLTISVGVAAWANSIGLDGLMRRAEVALYAAKASGRNRVSLMAGDAFVEYVAEVP